MRPKIAVVICTSACLLLPQSALAAPCAPCATGSYDPDLENREVEVPGLGSQPCSFMETATSSYLQDNTEQCSGQQAFGVYCGCPVPEGACAGFCESYNKETRVPNFLGLGDTYQPTCEQIFNYIQGAFKEGDSDCTNFIAAYGNECGCGAAAGGNDNDIFTDTNSTRPPETGGDVDLDLDQLYDSWTLCPDGSTVGYADREVSSLWSTTGANSSNPFVAKAALAVSGSVTCEGLDLVTRSGLWPDDLGVDSEERFILAGFCGCPPVHNACEFCPSNDISMPNVTFALTEVVFDLTASCQQLDDLLTQHMKTDLRCWSSKSFAFVCGCNGGTPWYLGADTETKHATLAWIPRVTGFLSFMGSLYIIYDVAKQRRKVSFWGTDTYHMILVGMSVFDISSSVAWMVSTSALPEYDEERQSEYGVYGAKGNDATCKAQGFFLELGFVGSTAFTACLTTFYVLTIIYGYREARMRPLQKYFMAVPTVLALSLASAAIPHYRPFYVACFVSNPNSEVTRDSDGWRHLIIFSILPIGISILISVCNMVAIFRFVGKQNKLSNRWRFGRFTFQPSNIQSSSLQGTSARSRVSSSSEIRNEEAVDAQENSDKDSESPSRQDEPVSNDQDAYGRVSFISTDQASDSRTKIQEQNPQGNTPLTQRSQRWSKTEAAVFFQAFSYVVAFLLTWVIYIVGQFKPYFSSDDEVLYAFWIVLLVLNPLMGFWNAFVYIKPWTWRWGGQGMEREPGARNTYRQSAKLSGPTSSNPPQLPVIDESVGNEEFDEEIPEEDIMQNGDEYALEDTSEHEYSPVLSAVFEASCEESTSEFLASETK
eukprot:CAMPEP_0168764426 /NCGR_PEP_ID=MMETSP0724-20121128/24867_1 /TAXON_ID=265536 /ORGANISM="Amphiprora sp., Strain CCMP467" /LENGTH=824 /DNA_ID=CAMNT_0008813649 /DNA_START=35 /DNA_END=2509 /DNA_ORIENTATION=+